MARLSSCIVLWLALAGCAAPPAAPSAPHVSPCAAGEASYACQVQRYHDVAQ